MLSLNVLGVGAKVSHDDNWLAHQDDFNDLLAHLNSENNRGRFLKCEQIRRSNKIKDINLLIIQGNSSEDQSSKNDMESIARKSKKRVLYVVDTK